MAPEPMIESILRERIDFAIAASALVNDDADALSVYRKMIIGGAIIGIACAMEYVAREEGAESEPLKDLHAAACRLGLESVGAIGRDMGKMQ